MTDSNDLTTAIQAIGEISKPATVLIEKISDAIGGVFKPYQIRRVARAEVDAAITRALGRREVKEIEQRGIDRMILIAGKSQQNIEQITAQAIPNIQSSANPSAMDDDWITNFFDKCQLVGDKQMQTLWGKILAGEANAPGAFSKRTIGIVATFDKKDADMFTTLCRFAWDFDGVMPIIFNHIDEVYQKNGLDHGVLRHLQAIGLIDFSHLTGFNLSLSQFESYEWVSMNYFGTEALFSTKSLSGGQIEVGQVILTEAGKELAPICGATPIEGFYQYVIDHWKKKYVFKS